MEEQEQQQDFFCMSMGHPCRWTRYSQAKDCTIWRERVHHDQMVQWRSLLMTPADPHPNLRRDSGAPPGYLAPQTTSAVGTRGRVGAASSNRPARYKLCTADTPAD